MKSCLSSILALLMTLSAAAMLCGCRNTTPPLPGPDSQTPAVSEKNPDDPSVPKLEIIKADRTTQYYVIRGENAASGELKAAVKLRSYLRDDLKIETVITDDWEKNPDRSDYEILVGKTVRESAETFLPDRALLGEHGYIIKATGTRVFICGGSDAATEAAVDRFISMIPKEGEFSLTDGYTYTCNTGASFAGLSFGSKSIPASEFGIAYERDDPTAVAAEKYVRSLFFERCGAYIEENGGSHRVILTTKAPEAEGNCFTARLSDEDELIISAPARVGLYRGVRDMFDDIAAGNVSDAVTDGNTLVFSDGFCYQKDYGNFVTYEDFGAKGDGKTCDVAALKNAHTEANAKKLPVLACEYADYYIDGSANKIPIGTDTDWSIAHFTIDDRNVASVGTEVFIINSSYPAVDISVSSLKKGQKNIGIKFDAPVIVTAVNSGVKQYIRYGANQDNGQSMQDIFLVDKDGNVDPETPILWDFDRITSINARKIDTEPLCLKGGFIETIANADSGKSYYYRGIRVYRSNVTVDGLTHTVSGEGADGAPYYGILIYNYTAGCVARNVTFTGHKTYKKIGSAGTSVSMGTYDITVTNSMGFRAENCGQTNDINDSTYWGVFASNTSKNITFDGCRFSRFDAHRGVCNVTLLNCELGHQGINLIGHGTARIENTTVYSQYFVNLRSDYGSTWEGDLIIRDCTYVPKNGAKCDAIVINGTNTDSHDFGYTCYLPENITIENLYINDSKASSKTVPPYLFAKFNSSWNSDSYVPKYAMVMPKSITAKNVTSASGNQLEVSSNKYFFKGITIDFK